MDKIKAILEKIESLKNDLGFEYLDLQRRYEYYLSKRKVIFTPGAIAFQKMKKISLFRYIFSAHARHILSMPFIYAMLFPWMFLDLFLTIYQNTAFPLYGIPKVKRSEFFIYDRKYLKYLNLIQKVNCLYCSYMNWLFSFASEIAWRTEQYWCPIKHAEHSDSEHRYFMHFADYWNSDDFKSKLTANICFNKN